MSNFKDPTDIRGQERLAEADEAKAALRRRTEVGDFVWLMSDKRGRRFVWRLLDKAGVFRSTFTGNSETFFRERLRNMGLFVLSEVHELTPDAFTQMLKEQKSYD